jgi:small nuclear ribonucleoprotein E
MTSSARVQKVLTQPINVIFRFLQDKSRVSIWLVENKTTRIEGIIVGFDEFMNIVLDNAEEVDLKKKTRRQMGRLMLKGDNVTLISLANVAIVS